MTFWANITYSGRNRSSKCQGGENFSDHCSQNGPSVRVWFDILLVAVVIFGFFVLYVRWERKRHAIHKDIDWWGNDDDDDTYTTSGSSMSLRGGGDAENPNRKAASARKERRSSRIQQPYYHMHSGHSAKQQQFQQQQHQPTSKGQMLLSACSTTSLSLAAYQSPSSSTDDAASPAPTNYAALTAAIATASGTPDSPLINSTQQCQESSAAARAKSEDPQPQNVTIKQDQSGAILAPQIQSQQQQ